VNLVSNIGFGIEATHTLGESEFAMMPVADIGELQHPTLVARNQCADNYTFETIFLNQIQSIQSSRSEQGEVTNSSSSSSVITEQINSEPISPLTKSNRIDLVDLLTVEKLIEDWKNVFSIDISEERISRYEKIHLFRCQDTQLLFYYPFDIAGSENLYNSLSRFDWYYMPGKWEHDVAAKSLEKCSRVLEIGAGYGAFIDRLVKDNFTEAIGIEQNKNAIKLAQEKDIPILDLTLDEISEKYREYFDVVCIFQVLEHATDPLEFLEKIIALIKDNGKIIVSVPNSQSFAQHDSNHLLDQPPHHMHRWNKQSFLSLSKILPIKLTKIRFEPLAKYHIDWFLNIQRSRVAKRRLTRKASIFVLNEILAPILKRSLVARKLVKGHTLYVEFAKKSIMDS
jgi:SAM-dependent methyltransferase